METGKGVKAWFRLFVPSVIACLSRASSFITVGAVESFVVWRVLVKTASVTTSARRVCSGNGRVR